MKILNLRDDWTVLSCGLAPNGIPPIAQKGARRAGNVRSRTYFRGAAWHGMAMIDTPAAIAAEIERRKAVALEAEQRYYDAIDTENPDESSAKRAAASAWVWALDALNDFRRAHSTRTPIIAERASRVGTG